MQTDFVKQIHYEKIKNKLNEIDDVVGAHPLLKYLQDIESKGKLPIEMIGDPKRLEQVIYNIIFYLIKHTKGADIFVDVRYVTNLAQLIFVVKDESICIKDQDTLFNLFAFMNQDFDESTFNKQD